MRRVVNTPDTDTLLTYIFVSIVSFGVIAGGYDACHRAVEASEDDENAGAEDFTGGQLPPGLTSAADLPALVNVLTDPVWADRASPVRNTCNGAPGASARR